ncbi:MAG: hypothetical protein JXC85_04430 [Candidatus Aenigmarchaeota archaeon]|nr:hypothetical protein [Candidatus Aenigmarchaeota archaeon]
MLEKVRFRDYDKGLDVEAFTDGYAYDEYSCPYLLSVGGRDGSVKAVTSALVSGRTVEIMTDRIIGLNKSYAAKYRILSGRLPGSSLHQVVAEEGFFRSGDRPESLLYVDNEDPARLVYETVRSSYPVPVVPDWLDWLYKKLRNNGHVREMLGTRKVLRLSVNERILDSLISEGIGNGEISF